MYPLRRACMKYCPIYRRSAGSATKSYRSWPTFDSFSGIRFTKHSVLPFASRFGKLYGLCPVKINISWAKLYLWRQEITQAQGINKDYPWSLEMGFSKVHLSYNYFRAKHCGMALKNLPKSLIYILWMFGESNVIYPPVPNESFKEMD